MRDQLRWYTDKDIVDLERRWRTWRAIASAAMGVLGGVVVGLIAQGGCG